MDSRPAYLVFVSSAEREAFAPDIFSRSEDGPPVPGDLSHSLSFRGCAFLFLCAPRRAQSVRLSRYIEGTRYCLVVEWYLKAVGWVVTQAATQRSRLPETYSP